MTKEEIGSICCELDCLLTNACEFIFTDEFTYEAIEKENITKIIYEYKDKLISEINIKGE